MALDGGDGDAGDRIERVEQARDFFRQARGPDQQWLPAVIGAARLIGDHLLVNKFVYGLKIPFTDKRVLKIRDPHRGDVIVFEYPEDPSKDFIKRVVGMPGDIVQVINKKVYVNGMLYQNPHEVHKEPDIIPEAQNPRDNTKPVKVPENSYFVMGDNRDRSYDSRFWGFVKNEKIRGLAFIKYWSWDREKNSVRWSRIGRWIE